MERVGAPACREAGAAPSAPAPARLPAGDAPVAAPRSATVSVIVPVFNARRHFEETLPALFAAGRRLGEVEFIFVDNGSSDGSYEHLCSLDHEAVQVHRLEHATIAAVRNYGARQATGRYLSFIDADCVVPECYFEQAIDTLRSTGAAATGCEVEIPPAPHWIEATWHHLHYVGRDRYVHYLNSANFFVSRAVFLEVGGFREDLLTGEDAEIGQRVAGAGHTLFECTRVGAIHLGNPKSVRQFYRRTVWHALGMFGTVGGKRFDKPTAMMLGHLAATLAGVGVLAAQRPAGGAGLALALALQLAVPVTTVAFRTHQTRRPGRVVAGVALYWLYYWARLQAFVLILGRRSDRYRK